MLDDASFFRQALADDQSRADAQLPVRFEWFDQEDPEETKKCGYTRYKRIQIIRTLIPGSKEDRVDRVNEDYKRRFPRQWAAFLAGEEGVVDGTPLKDFPGLTKDDISTLMHFHVLSVEQLAAMSDENATNIGHGFRQRRDGAKAWLAARKSAQPVAELNAKLKEKDEQVAALMERLAALESAQAGSVPLKSIVVPVTVPLEAAPEAKPKPKRIRTKKPKAEQPEG